MSAEIDLRSPLSLPPTANYSHIAIIPATARTIYISGQVPMSTEGVLVGKGDFEAQAMKVFENTGVALREAGTDFSALVKIGLYVKDMRDLPILRRVRDQFILPERAPTSILVQVSAFFHPEILVEMDAVAVI